MTRRLKVTLGVVAALVGILGVSNLRRPPIKDGGDLEPSPCLAGATIALHANPNQILLGQPSVVSWSVTLPAGCSSVHIYFDHNPVTASSSRNVSPSATRIYTLTVTDTRDGVHQETYASTSIQVTYPPRVIINPSTPDPVAVLLGALASSNEPQVVELCDVDLDLTGHNNVVLGELDTLIASPECARGPRRLGPRIYVTDPRAGPLFEVRGDRVRISGFRLEGPTSEVSSREDAEQGIRVWPFPGTTPIASIEISNMEIYHWAALGVSVTDNTEQAERGRLFNTREAVRIVDNYLHHNRHISLGYGAEVGGGGYALIARNVFDGNRHAIAGGRKNADAEDYPGYIARDNLVLPGGGLACSDFFLFALIGWRRNCWQTHQIDMHGNGNSWYSSSNWRCGVAGETIIIQRNTILYTEGTVIKIRGNPTDKAIVDGNVFKHKRDDAIVQYGACGAGDNITNPIDIRPNNVFGVDPTTELGKCDFYGDGQKDDFMATGVTWWARSPVTGQWRYLNTMPEKLSQLSLEYVDADAVCDVMHKRTSIRSTTTGPRTYSKSGTGPWTPVSPLVVAEP